MNQIYFKGVKIPCLKAHQLKGELNGWMLTGTCLKKNPNMLLAKIP